MKRLTIITCLLSILSLLMATSGCDKGSVDGWSIAGSFSMIIVDENGTNLIDSLSPNNIIGKVDIEVVCRDGKVIPMLWIPDETARPIPSFPGTSKDNPGCIDYASKFNCLVIGYWDNDSKWESSFRIKIPEYSIDLNVQGHNDYLYDVWKVNSKDCKPIMIDSVLNLYVDYKLVLPVVAPTPKE